MKKLVTFGLITMMLMGKVMAMAQHGGESSSVAVLGGLTHIGIDDKEDSFKNSLSDNFLFGLELFTQLSPRMDVGLGLSYTSVKFVWRPFVNNYAFSYDDPESDITGRILSFNLQGRYYLSGTRSNSGRPRFFAGGILGLNSLKLDFKGPYDPYGSQLQQNGPTTSQLEEFSSTYANIGLGMGVTIQLGDNFGLIVQGQFTKNFFASHDGGRVSRNSQFGYPGSTDRTTPLEDLGKKIEKGSEFGLLLGIMANF